MVDQQGLASSSEISYAKFMILVWTGLAVSCGFNRFLTKFQFHSKKILTDYILMIPIDLFYLFGGWVA